MKALRPVLMCIALAASLLVVAILPRAPAAHYDEPIAVAGFSGGSWGGTGTVSTFSGGTVTTAINVLSSGSSFGSTTANVITSNVANTGGNDTFWDFRVPTPNASGDTIFRFADGTTTYYSFTKASIATNGASLDLGAGSATMGGAIVRGTVQNDGGALTLASGANGAINCTPNGTGVCAINKHLAGNGAQAAANAGTGTCTSITVSGTDVDGKITATCTAGQTVIVNFGATFASAPFCLVSPIDSNAAAGTPFATTSTTQLTMTSKNTTTSAANFAYVCIQ